ncbi:MAG TPA: radical SAM protein, partial [Puia sp.]
MRGKVLITHSYFLRFDPKQWATGRPYAPLGTLYATSFLKKHGYEVSFFDTMFSRDPGEVIPAIEEIKPDIFVIYDDGFNYLTKMCLENMREAAFVMIQAAKKRGCTVIISSSDSTDRFEMYLDKGADFIMLGEAELTLLELSNALKSGKTDYFSIEGLAFRQNEATLKTKRRNVIKDLDALPFPAWDMISMDPYRDMWLAHAGYFSMNMGTTRGCPFKCNWCA